MRHPAERAGTGASGRKVAAAARRVLGLASGPAAAGVLAACVTTGPGTGQELAASEAGRVFTTGYESIARRYVEPVAIGDVALEGLKGLDTVDGELLIRRLGGVIEVSRRERVLADFEAPPLDDVGGWADLTLQAIDTSATWSNQVGTASAERVYEAVFDAAVRELDEFSRYAGAKAARQHRAMREGFGGIGIKVAVETKGVRVTEVAPETPAARAELRAGDLITHIDESAIVGKPESTVLASLRGPVESRVALTLDRESMARPLRVTLTRDLIIPPTVTARLEGDLAYLKVSGFNQRTAVSVARELGALEKEHEITGLILDLRDNPGGLLDQAVAVADLFLDTGRIITTQGRHPDSNQRFDASGEDIAADLPMVVLINGDSASAAEIVGAALQDRGRAVVVGSNSFGKGTVQNVIHLPNEGELTLTWSRIHAPSGYVIHHLGILPNICTSTAAVTGPEVADDIRNGRLIMAEALSRWRTKHSPEGHEVAELRAICPSAHDSPDTDLAVATELLADPALYARAVQQSFPSVATR